VLRARDFDRRSQALARQGFSRSAPIAVRRAGYARRLFPDIEVDPLSRRRRQPAVRKLDNRKSPRLPDGGAVGPADALIMARSGLRRVGLASRMAYEFSIRENAAGGGAGHRRGRVCDR